MTGTSPSRRTRWAIGLGVVSIFAAVSLGATAVAVMEILTAQAADTSASQSGDEYTLPLDSTATAVVLDIDTYTYDDQPTPYIEDDGYTLVDIRFKSWAVVGAEKDSEIAVVAMQWDQELDLPAVGDKLKIRYRSGDPEYAPQLVDAPASDPDRAAPPVSDTAAPGTGVPALTRWTIGVSGLLALIALAATAIWARRAEPTKAPRPSPIGWTPPPPPRYQYPEPEYTQPQSWEPQYMQPQYPLPQYQQPAPTQPRPAQYPAQYPAPAPAQQPPAPAPTTGLAPPG
jgi:hypothetical protein